jgi:stage III sporulation protein SpoIIIAA
MSIVKRWALPAGGVKESDGTVEEMRLLFEKLPVELSQHIQQMFGADKLLQLNEIYLQLGQRPECIFTNDGGSITRQEILDEPCTNAHIDIFQKFFLPEDDSTQSSALTKRKGISGTLHRVSLITKPSAHPEKVLGVTVRVGRAMQGLIETMTGGNTFLHPLALQRRSLLLIGKPGVGKTTALREIALMLSADPSLRVVVVDKSLEIAGDGDSPHAAIGK